MDQQQPKRPGPKGPRTKFDETSPAYRIIYGLFADRADFCRKTRTPHGTAHLWLCNGDIPAARRNAVIANAAAEGVTIPTAMFERRADAA
jgi:hypothetical protein